MSLPVELLSFFDSWPEPYDHAPKAMTQKTLMMTVFWILMFVFARWFVQRTPLVKHLQPQEITTWGMKACCVLHASFQGAVGTYIMLYDPQISPQIHNFLAGRPYNVITTISDNVALFFPITLGFFMYELVCLPLWWSPKEAPMVFHHIVPQLLLTSYHFDTISAFFLFTEITSPFIQLRWFFEKHLGRKHILYTINGLVMVVLFFVIRVLPIPYYHMSILGNLDIISKLPLHEQAYSWAYHCPSFLNVYWAKLMLDGLLKLVFAKPAPAGADAAAKGEKAKRPKKE